MKNIYSIVIAMIVLVLTSCSKAPSSPEKIFTVKMDAANPTTANWVLIHDVNGNLIDYKKIAAGDNLTFRTLKPIPNNELTVTLFSDLTNIGNLTYQLATYCNVTRDDSWTLKSIAQPWSSH